MSHLNIFNSWVDRHLLQLLIKQLSKAEELSWMKAKPQADSGTRNLLGNAADGIKA